MSVFHGQGDLGLHVQCKAEGILSQLFAERCHCAQGNSSSTFSNG